MLGVIKQTAVNRLCSPLSVCKLISTGTQPVSLQLLLLAVVLVRNGQLCTSLSATSCQYATAILCSHSLTETVLVLSLSVRGLECSFHRLIFFICLIQTLVALFSSQNYSFFSYWQRKRRLFFPSIALLSPNSCIVNLYAVVRHSSMCPIDSIFNVAVHLFFLFCCIQLPRKFNNKQCHVQLLYCKQHIFVHNLHLFDNKLYL